MKTKKHATKKARKAARPKATKPAARSKGGITDKRAEILASEKFKKAHAAALAKRKRGPLCKRGHDLRVPENVHTGDLFRDGVVTCRTCWQEQNSDYLARTAKEAK